MTIARSTWLTRTIRRAANCRCGCTLTRHATCCAIRVPTSPGLRLRTKSAAAGEVGSRGGHASPTGPDYRDQEAGFSIISSRVLGDSVHVVEGFAAVGFGRVGIV